MKRVSEHDEIIGVGIAIVVLFVAIVLGGCLLILACEQVFRMMGA